MKAKKLMFGIMGAVAMITSANAITEDQCRKSANMHWVSANGECVPKNTCDSARHVNDYCIRDFKDVQTGTLNDAIKLAEGYLYLVKDVYVDTCARNYTGKEESMSGQNYIACTFGTGKGGLSYTVFEFDDTTHGHEGRADLEYDEVTDILCAGIKGQKVDGYCKEISSDDCYRLREVLGSVHKLKDGDDFSDFEGCPMYH